jgi:hypothetical protein
MAKAPLVKAEHLAWFLASYAKDALKNINEKDAIWSLCLNALKRH